MAHEAKRASRRSFPGMSLLVPGGQAKTGKDEENKEGRGGRLHTTCKHGDGECLEGAPFPSASCRSRSRGELLSAPADCHDAFDGWCPCLEREPITRVSEGFPAPVRQRFMLRAPLCCRFHSTGTSEPMLEQRPAAPAPVWGEYVSHAHCSRKNVVNGILFAVALVPSFVATAIAYTRCDPQITDKYATPGEACCSVAMGQPIAFANLLFFVNVSFGFWVVGLLQRSFWLIDPYWTLIPPLLGHFYQLHPNAHYNTTRSAIGLSLLWLWCIRLTHSYFRREEWKFGQREDWRYTKMAGDMPRAWWLVSFFAVGIAQQPMLIGIMLPAYTIHFVSSPLGWVDALAIGFAISGLLTAWVSDNQLRRYMLHNEHLTTQGKPKMKLLNSGMWRFSRRTLPSPRSIAACGTRMPSHATTVRTS